MTSKNNTKLDQVVLHRLQQLADESEIVKTAKRSSGFFTDQEAFQAWAIGVLNLLQRVFGEDSVHYRSFLAEYQVVSREGFEVSSCLGIFKAAKIDYENGYLFKVKTLIKAEVFDNTLEQAEELLRKGYKDSACVLTGGVLELTLKELSDHNGLPHQKMSVMNIELYKANVYNTPKMKLIESWILLRNRGAHAEWDQYNEADVQRFIEDLKRFMADYL